MAYARSDQSFPTVPGITYDLNFDITNAWSQFLPTQCPTAKVYIGSSQGAGDLLTEACEFAGSYNFQFTATGTTSWIRYEVTIGTGGGIKVDNVSVKATSAAVYEGGGLNQLLKGIAANHEVIWEFLKTLKWIREPSRTAVLDDLEREYGIWPNSVLTDQARRDKLAAVKYARVGTGSKDNLQTALHTAGFDELFVWENSPAQDPAIFFGGALMYCQESPNLFVSVAGTGTNRVMTSPDGITWTLRSSPTNVWRDVCYGVGLYVAVASSGTNDRVMTSPDGITWTSRDTTGKNNDWLKVCYGAGLYVAVASSGTDDRVMTSPDGITWTSRDTTGKNNNWKDVCYGNGIFVAVSDDGGTSHVMTSPDGITWTLRTTPDRQWRAVIYGDGIFVAIANSGTGDRVMTSPDGITWTLRSSAADENWNGLTHCDSLFVATATSGTGNRVMTSPDGITWTSRSSAADDWWWSVTWGIVPQSLAQCGEPLAQCGKFQGELIVNGDIYAFSIDYVVECGEPLAQCDEPTALVGNLTGVTRTKIEYPIPTNPIDWPLVFFVGGDATFNPDTGASIYCDDTLAQCDEPTAFCQWFEGQLQDIEFVDIPFSRRADLVRLILQIKPIHSWCALLVNYT